MPDQPMATEGGIVCNGAEDMEIRDRHIATDGDAIVINGACTITIVNSKIEAAGWAIVVNGSGDVVVIDSGRFRCRWSVALNGASDLRARGSQFFGRVARNGVADITRRRWKHLGVAALCFGGSLFRGLRPRSPFGLAAIAGSARILPHPSGFRGDVRGDP